MLQKLRLGLRLLRLLQSLPRRLLNEVLLQRGLDMRLRMRHRLRRRRMLLLMNLVQELRLL